MLIPRITKSLNAGHGLDREVEGSNLAAAGCHQFNIFQASSNHIKANDKRKTSQAKP